jgi:hypothetical protein
MNPEESRPTGKAASGDTSTRKLEHQVSSTPYPRRFGYPKYFAALKGRQVPSLQLEGILSSTVHHFLLECQPKHLHVTFSMQPPDERLFHAMVTDVSCSHIRIRSESCICKVHFLIPLNQPLAPIRILSLTVHTSLKHLFQSFGCISSTQEKLFLWGRIDLAPPPAPSNTPS